MATDCFLMARCSAVSPYPFLALRSYETERKCMNTLVRAYHI